MSDMMDSPEKCSCEWVKGDSPECPWHGTTEAQIVQAETKWRSTKPWITDEWLEWWKGLDHSRCSQSSDDLHALGVEAYYAAPGYLKCHSMHCPDCGKPTGSQGHHPCPERKDRYAYVEEPDGTRHAIYKDSAFTETKMIRPLDPPPSVP